MDESLAWQVRERAAYVCEYCHIPQIFYPTVPFPIDHIVAVQHGGDPILACLLHSVVRHWTTKSIIMKPRRGP
jgi:hypothetical protein